jgi:UDP-N-acetylmuramoyl-tripeptide--D-alanyl-D-alanine ligase
MCEMTLHQLHEIVGGRLRLATLGPRDGEWTHVARFCADSRQLQPGEVFWALTGRVHDGSSFIESAFARGASGVVAAKYVQPWPSCWALQVDDSREALFRLARWHRDQFHGRLITVGGVAGTATTRRLIATVLGSQFAGSSCPQRGHRLDSVALGMLGLEASHHFAVFDLNLAAPGDASSLIAECAASIGVITDVTKPRAASTNASLLHDAAVQLLAHLPRDGHAVLGGDDPAIRRAAEYCQVPITWVGESSDCNLMATRVLSTEGRLSFVVDGQAFQVAAWGRHQLTNILCAIGVGRVFGLSLGEIARALEALDPPPHKCDALEGENGKHRLPETAIPSILKFQAARPKGESIVQRLGRAASDILWFDPAHRLTLRPAA